MNWDAIQAVAELMAASGVVISLVYLSTQVRQNTKSIRSAANQDLLTSLNTILDFSKQSAHGSDIYDALARGDLSDLTPGQRGAARNTLVQMCRLYEQAFLQHRAGLLDDEVWAGWSRQITMSVGFPGFRLGWPAIRPMLNPTFSNWVDSLTTQAGQVLGAWGDAWGESMVGPSAEAKGPVQENSESAGSTHHQN